MTSKGTTKAGTVGLYARISLDRNDGEGVARQLDDATQLAAERWPEANVVQYVDNSVSAFRKKRRPEFDRLVDDLDAGRLTAVVAYHPDRLYRQLTDLERFVHAVRSAGAQVATCRAGDIDLSTASGQMTAEILASVAKHEAARIGERVSRAKQERAAQGRPAGGGLRPFGLNADRTDLVKTEAKVLQEAADAILGGTSWTKVVQGINDDGIHNTTGREWTVGNLRRTLTSPHVAGLRAYKGEIVGQAAWPAILERGTWERLRADAATRKRGRPPSDRHLLTGLLTCGRCGFSLHANHTGKNDRWEYRCSPSSTTKGRGCGRMSISRDPLDALVTALVHERVDAGPLTAAAEQIERQPEHAADIEVIEAELNALADDHGAGRITRGEWMRAREGLARRLDEAKAALAAETSTGAYADLVDLDDRWDELDTERRRNVIATLVEMVTISPAAKRGMPPVVEGIGRIDLDRVDVTWRI